MRRETVSDGKPNRSDAVLWDLSTDEVLRRLGTSAQGLTGDQAAERLEQSGRNLVHFRSRSDVVTLLIRQFASPIILLLICASVLAYLLEDEAIDCLIILAIVFASGLLGFWQERHATRAVEQLLTIIEPKAAVLRDGREQSIPAADVAPGDVLALSAGAGIPADCRLIVAHDLFINEAALTGETFPVEKTPADTTLDVPLLRRQNALFLGTHVVSGSGRAVVVQTGRRTEFGAIAERLRRTSPETEFERGIRRFGYLLVEMTLLLVTLIFGFNVALHRPVIDSFLFALALAVGLTPQLLPAIISVNLSHGAAHMAALQVIVKRLAAIENFGSMDVLCSDKTGTLTEGRVRLQGAWNVAGEHSPRVLSHACVNSRFETGYANPIDEALRSLTDVDTTGWTKLDEIPYDFLRKRLSVLADYEGRKLLISKGALKNILDVCCSAESNGGQIVPLEQVESAVDQQQQKLAGQGYRTLGVAIRELPPDHPALRHDDEAEMTFLGIISLYDPPKSDIADSVASLRKLGVTLKMITGDNALVAESVAREVGIAEPRVLRGADIHDISDAALPIQADETDVFAEIEPNQKERIIRALRTSGHVVGYMGDGINDAPAMHAADVSISVQGAVDVAREAADVVLLARDLSVLEAGVRASRQTFANTLKYVFMATSANFGNMFSMAGASLFLPFLPLLPKQILLMNLLTDAPELAIATDRVDPEWIAHPRRWDIRFIRNFMLTFGILSSVFDYLTFGVLMIFLRADEAVFRTGWFLESVTSATLIVLVVRTPRNFLTSRPSRILCLSSLFAVIAALIVPFTPLANVFGFVPVPFEFVAIMAVIVVLYVAGAEMVKRWFYAHG